MKKLLLTMAAGIALCSCGSHDPQIAIVPYPNHLETGRGTYRVTDRPVTCDSRTDERTQRAVVGFAARLATVTGGTNPVTVADEVPASGIRFVTDESLPAEGYELNVDGEGIEVRASQFPGFLYALQSLEQLLPAAVYGTEPAPDAAWEVPCVKIADAPRFAYRGMHLDVARHFFSVDEVKRYIDVMAIHKLNTLHWHLTDDQGWRIEIKRYPELTAVGSIRKATVVRKEWGTYDGTPYGGFYTQDEIRDVVKYAADRGVTVIPEIALPGHMLAALTAYPELGCTGGPYEVWGRWGVADDVLCPGREKTFEFLEGVLTEVMELFPSEYIHIGGDECPKVRWEKCPRCQAKIRQLGLKDDGEHTAEHYLQSYVTDRIGKFLAQHGRRIIGWGGSLGGGGRPPARQSLGAPPPPHHRLGRDSGRQGALRRRCHVVARQRGRNRRGQVGARRHHDAEFALLFRLLPVARHRRRAVRNRRLHTDGAGLFVRSGVPGADARTAETYSRRAGQPLDRIRLERRTPRIHASAASGRLERGAVVSARNEGLEPLHRQFQDGRNLFSDGI